MTFTWVCYRIGESGPWIMNELQLLRILVLLGAWKGREKNEMEHRCVHFSRIAIFLLTSMLSKSLFSFSEKKRNEQVSSSQLTFLGVSFGKRSVVWVEIWWEHFILWNYVSYCRCIFISIDFRFFITLPGQTRFVFFFCRFMFISSSSKTNLSDRTSCKKCVWLHFRSHSANILTLTIHVLLFRTTSRANRKMSSSSQKLVVIFFITIMPSLSNGYNYNRIYGFTPWSSDSSN